MNDTSTRISPLDLFRLDGQVALVTGASSGLGARFARVLHAAGAQVVISARRKDRLEALAQELPGSVVIQCDVSKEEEREHAIAETIAQCGRLDVLVNNAGIGDSAPIEKESLDSFREVMEVNTIAVWHLAKLAGIQMVKQGSGSIVNVSSMLGLVGSTPIKQSSYCTSKGALINMTRELALQWARKGVRVNALCPGWFPSEMTAPMEEDAPQKFIMQNSPIPRMGYEHELDGALLYLASPASTFMTGQQMVVDGGWTAR
jgi:NAD(P)-dependent dehydrogenase (short-subunit alcohol dehydrogenase family)